MFQCPDLKSFGLADLGTVCKEGQISFSAVCPQAIAETVTSWRLMTKRII